MVHGSTREPSGHREHWGHREHSGTGSTQGHREHSGHREHLGAQGALGGTGSAGGTGNPCRAGQEGTQRLTLSLALMSRPRDRKCSTISTCPVRTATCRGVLSSWVGGSRTCWLKGPGLWCASEGGGAVNSSLLPRSGRELCNFPSSYLMV